MCDNLLTYTNYEPLYEIANNIIKNQTNGVIQMKNLLRTTMTRALPHNSSCIFLNSTIPLVCSLIIEFAIAISFGSTGYCNKIWCRVN